MGFQQIDISLNCVILKINLFVTVNHYYSITVYIQEVL